jgi:proteasome lid subunit RPN8/RPN11
MLKISKSHYEALRKHSEQAYPHECCGVLIGKLEEGDRVVKGRVACRNAHTETPAARYNIAPEELVAAQKAARAQGLDIIGFYHSHPDHPPRWSSHDLEEAHWFACSYVITAVDKGKAGRTSSYVLCGIDEESKRFDDENIEVTQ